MRRLRAALILGAIWALAWLPLGALVAAYAAASPPQPDDFLHRPVEFPIFVTVWCLWGWLSGTAFALLLGTVERRRSVAQLSLPRTALWGALGAMSAPALLVAIDVTRGMARSSLYDWRVPLVSLLSSAILGGGCAATTLLVARRGR